MLQRDTDGKGRLLPPLWCQCLFSVFFPAETVVVGEDGTIVEAGVVEFFFNAEKLIVLGDTVGTAGGAGLDLAGVGAHGKVGDEAVFSFAGAMGGDGGRKKTWAACSSCLKRR